MTAPVTPGPATSAPAPPPTAQPASTAPGTVAASDTDNGRILTLRVGQHLRLVLSSTYWTVAGSSNAAVLRPSGAPRVSPQPSGCVPGSGCGTVTADFDAVAPGRSDVSATRNSCGEAAGCTGASGSFRLTLLVTA